MKPISCRVFNKDKISIPDDDVVVFTIYLDSIPNIGDRVILHKGIPFCEEDQIESLINFLEECFPEYKDNYFRFRVIDKTHMRDYDFTFIQIDLQIIES